MTRQRHGEGTRIGPGGQQFRGDDGTADPAVTAALRAWRDGEGTERAALIALNGSRLLVPVVAILGEADESGADKASEMAMPKLIGQDGRPAIVAFTGTAALARWRSDARPVPAEAIRVWQAAVAESCAVVIDVAGPVPLAVEGARLAAMAAGQPPPLPHEDPGIAAVVSAAIAGLAAITGFRLEAGSVGLGSDLAVRLTVAAGPGTPDEVSEVAERIGRRLAGRVRAVEITTE